MHWNAGSAPLARQCLYVFSTNYRAMGHRPQTDDLTIPSEACNQWTWLMLVLKERVHLSINCTTSPLYTKFH